MNINNNPKAKIGDCEVCDATNTTVYLMHSNITMCEECKDKETAAIKMIEDSRVIDSSVTLKTDVFLVKTVPAVELRAAIENNSEIPADQKEYAFANECYTRYQGLQKAIFDKRSELHEMEDELRMWQVNTQNSAGKLRAELRDHFKELNVNYQPQTITKKQKTTKPTTSKKAFDKTALFNAAKKYDVPSAQVQSIVIAQNKSPEDAAKYLAGLLGKL